MAKTLQLISKEKLIATFKEIESRGWIEVPKKRKASMYALLAK